MQCSSGCCALPVSWPYTNSCSAQPWSEHRPLLLLTFPSCSGKEQWSNWGPAHTEEVLLGQLERQQGLGLQQGVQVDLAISPTAQEEVPGGGRKKNVGFVLTEQSSLQQHNVGQCWCSAEV